MSVGPGIVGLLLYVGVISIVRFLMSVVINLIILYAIYPSGNSSATISIS
jgi:hypothetical protein